MQFLTGFVEELREVGIPVSMVEVVDAARALEQVDIGRRSQVKATLQSTLIKSYRHLDAFDIAFEIYFSLLGPDSGSDEEARRRLDDMGLIGEGGGGGGGGAADESELVEALFRAMAGDEPGQLEAVIREAVTRMAAMEPGRPVGGAFYVYRVLRNLQIESLRTRLADLLTADVAGLEARLGKEEADRRIEALKELLRAEIRRRLVADRGPEAVARTLRRPLVEDIDLVTATRDDIAALEAAVHPLTRKLATRLARRRRLGSQGRLDVRRTLRRSLSTGGVPVDPAFRRPRPSRPDIVILADISGSVATFARFTMQMVFAISSQLRRVRSFAFIDTVDEVTRMFGPGVDFGEAMRRVGTEASVVWLDGHSDYGNAFQVFVDRYGDALTPRTTVIVAGDARTNYHDPNVPELHAIAEASRALYWMNPERSRYWDTGDSVMGMYTPLCDGVFEVRNLRQLEHFVEKVALPTTRPVKRPA